MFRKKVAPGIMRKYGLFVRLVPVLLLTCVILIAGLGVRDMVAQAPEMATTEMKLYFMDVEGERLAPERRTIDYSGNIVDQIKLTLIELARGSQTGLMPVIPQGVEIREAFLDEKGCVYVDFSRAISQNHPGGATDELFTVMSIVNTLTSSFPKEVRKVKILVDGREVNTIAGHIDVSKPISLF